MFPLVVGEVDARSEELDNAIYLFFGIDGDILVYMHQNRAT